MKTIKTIIAGLVLVGVLTLTTGCAEDEIRVERRTKIDNAPVKSETPQPPADPDAPRKTTVTVEQKTEIKRD